MKLSTRARYALRMMLELVKQADSRVPVSLNKVARTTGVTRRYLEQLAIDMKEASLIKGFPGKAGGYLLARPPEEIKVGQIVEAAIGPINIVDCLLYPEECLKSDICECRVVYQIINRKITDVLGEFSLAELADKDWLRKMKDESSGPRARAGATRNVQRFRKESKDAGGKKGGARHDPN